MLPSGEVARWLLMADPAPTLSRLVQEAIGAAFGPELAGVDPVLRRSQHPRFGDYQANVAMALAKRLGRAPREVAGAIVEHLSAGGVCRTVEVAGPGFINLTLEEAYLASQIEHAASDPRLDVPEAAQRHTFVVDYSAPNSAKEMHIGHLRSTVIGDALARTLGWLGHGVIRQNHIGDWGTQFGMLIEHLATSGWRPGSSTISDLNQLYQEAQAAFESDPAFAERARRRVVALQSGDPATLALWRELIRESERHMEEVYSRLGVLLTREDMRGESFYNDLLEPTVEELSSKGLLRIDDGALCAFPPGFTGRDGTPLPMIVRKSDGGFNYNTTDLAAVRFRVRELGADRLVYVVDARQAQHFAMLFAIARQAGWLGEEFRAEHVAFGTILGPDGRPFRTRAGGTVRLSELLDEAAERAAAIVADKNPDLTPSQRAEVARAVGIGAVKYADLANDRVKDYVFDWDRMLAMDGNTAPYLQYAHARIRSIFRRGEEALSDGIIREPGQSVTLVEPAERALALELVGLAGVLNATADHLEPHRICTYLFDLASAFTTFYECCPVLRAPSEESRTSRLTLCEVTAQTLSVGLGLLGIEAPERM